jgi:hypothetical protein
MDGRVGLLAKCPESDNYENNPGLNPQYNKVNRAMIDMKKNSAVVLVRETKIFFRVVKKILPNWSTW